MSVLREILVPAAAVAAAVAIILAIVVLMGRPEIRLRRPTPNSRRLTWTPPHCRTPSKEPLPCGIVQKPEPPHWRGRKPGQAKPLPWQHP